ncbi:methanogen output domain 1-containing protein [Methanobacterium aggregans]|uniref:methanogen output domain 1-containing protein n=1 Tax=Methanobacterium aggregans TaxID=1615586 RepID=UPI001AE9D61D|nr:methanogen output domain 1-containing protein [Methanobacterium aggregans]MBP2044865.1 CheY-like chemotaxis protein [Methanobacterium aggregans]
MDNTRVLIIEDESITALEIHKKLETWGYHVVGVAGSGEEAVEIARENRLDLILADIILKGDMDGVEAIEQIYEITDAPVIYLTAHADESTFKRAKETKPAGYVIKPYDEKELAFNMEIALYNRKVKSRVEESEERLKAMNQFLHISSRAMTSSMRIEDTAGFLKEFARFFQSNIHSRFRKDLLSENSMRSDEELLEDYLEWVSQFFTNLGYKVDTQDNSLLVNQCFWGSRRGDNKTFCLMCKAMTELSFKWTGLPGHVEHESGLGLNHPTCVFRFEVEE